MSKRSSTSSNGHNSSETQAKQQKLARRRSGAITPKGEGSVVEVLDLEKEEVNNNCVVDSNLSNAIEDARRFDHCYRPEYDEYMVVSPSPRPTQNEVNDCTVEGPETGSGQSTSKSPLVLCLKRLSPQKPIQNSVQLLPESSNSNLAATAKDTEISVESARSAVSSLAIPTTCVAPNAEHNYATQVESAVAGTPNAYSSESDWVPQIMSVGSLGPTSTSYTGPTVGQDTGDLFDRMRVRRSSGLNLQRVRTDKLHEFLNRMIPLIVVQKIPPQEVVYESVDTVEISPEEARRRKRVLASRRKPVETIDLTALDDDEVVPVPVCSANAPDKTDDDISQIMSASGYTEGNSEYQNQPVPSENAAILTTKLLKTVDNTVIPIENSNEETTGAERQPLQMSNKSNSSTPSGMKLAIVQEPELKDLGKKEPSIVIKSSDKSTTPPPIPTHGIFKGKIISTEARPESEPPCPEEPETEPKSDNRNYKDTSTAAAGFPVPSTLPSATNTSQSEASDLIANETENTGAISDSGAPSAPPAARVDYLMRTFIAFLKSPNPCKVQTMAIIRADLELFYNLLLSRPDGKEMIEKAAADRKAAQLKEDEKNAALQREEEERKAKAEAEELHKQKVAIAEYEEQLREHSAAEMYEIIKFGFSNLANLYPSRGDKCENLWKALDAFRSAGQGMENVTNVDETG